MIQPTADPIDYLQVDPDMDPLHVWYKWEEKLSKLIAEKPYEETEPVLQALHERLSQKSRYSNVLDYTKLIDDKIQAGIESVLERTHWTAGGYTWKYEDALLALDLQEKFKTPLSEKMRESASKKLASFADKHPDQACRFARAFEVSEQALHEYVTRNFNEPGACALQADGLTHIPIDHPDVHTNAGYRIHWAIELNHDFDEPAQIKKDYALGDGEFVKAVREALLFVLGICRSSLKEIDTWQEKTGVILDWNAPDVIEKAKHRAKGYFWINKEFFHELPELKRRVPTCLEGEAEVYVLERFVAECKYGNTYNKFKDAKKYQEILETTFGMSKEKMAEAIVPLFAEHDIKNPYHCSWYTGLVEHGFISKEQLRERAETGIWVLLRETDDRSLKQAQEIREAFGITPERYRALSIDAFHEVLATGKSDATKSSLRDRDLPEGFLDDAKTREAARKGVLTSMQDHGMMYRSINLIEQFGFEDAKSDPAVLAAARKVAASKIFETAEQIHWEEWNEQCPFFSIRKPSDLKGAFPALDGIIDLWAFPSMQALYDFLVREAPLRDLLRKDPTLPMSLTKEDLPLIKKYRLSLYECECAKRGGFRFDEEKAMQEYREKLRQPHVYELTEPCTLATALRYTCKEWEDEQNIAGPFREGAARFGNRQMLEYMNREKLSRHDALHAFLNVIQLQEATGVDPKAFNQNILRQVVKDGATYNEGTAHHKLNSIVQSIDFFIPTTLAAAREYRELPELQELLTTYTEPAQVCASWKALKRYSELENILKKKEVLDQLTELKAQGKEKLYNFVSKLVFHPNSNVNIGAVIEFWRDPRHFLDRADSHTPAEVQNRKKPSNFTHVPFLDLTAEELRDAQVEGDLDRLQVFKPLEIRYKLPKDGIVYGTVRLALNAAIGSQAMQRAPKAVDHRKIFGRAAKLLKGICTVQDYIEGHPIDATLEKEIEKLVYDKQLGIQQEGVTVVAKMNLKSDPDGILAGDDTACCMPFGSGKKIVYDFNPDTAQFILQMETGGGTMRTIAQSVMTKDTDIGKLIPDVIKALSEKGTDLTSVLPEEVLHTKERVIAADNVEVAKNYAELGKLIETVYRDFFREYLARFGEAGNFNGEKMVIGKGYSDSLNQLPEVPNTFAPDAPVGYSDKTHDKVYVLDLTGNPASVKKEVLTSEAPLRLDGPASEEISVRGVSDLDFSDTLRVAYLEGKLYSDNETLITYLHNIENALIGIGINNNAKKRRNLCLKYEHKGQIAGYMMAYEGAVRGEDLEDDPELQNMKGKSVIYISDLAADAKKSAVAGGKITQEFLARYTREYLQKGNMMPIFLQAREQTSYKMFGEGHFQRHLEKIKAELLEDGIDIDFKMRELPIYSSGADTMHPIVIEPVMKNAEVEKERTTLASGKGQKVSGRLSRMRGAFSDIFASVAQFIARKL